MECSCVTRLEGGFAYIRPCPMHRSLTGQARLQWIMDRTQSKEAVARAIGWGRRPGTTYTSARPNTVHVTPP